MDAKVTYLSEADVAWHTFGPAEVLELLETPRQGLTSAEAQARLERFGPNALPESPRRSALARLAGQFNNLLIYVLIASGGVTALLGHWTDTIVILAVVFLNAAIGFWQEGRAEDALAGVRSMLSANASVLRDGLRINVPAADLVQGDVVLVEAGDRVPADLRLFEARGLLAQEAALTGESVPVAKDTAPVAREAPLGDRASMMFSGTLATSGRGLGLVVATGSDARIGKIGAMLGEIEEMTTPLLKQIDRFARWLTLIIVAAGAAVFAFAVLVRGYALEDAFLAMVGMAVAAIPEGLPAVMTITLAIGVQRMAARHAIVRRLPAVETLGAVSVICTDKTGTLTRNEMVVRTLITEANGDAIAVTGEGYAPEGELRCNGARLTRQAELPPHDLARAGVLSNDARIYGGDDGSWTVAGDPMEGALITLAHKAGLDPEKERDRHRRLDDIPFDAAHRFMATLNADGETGNAIYVKGAPDDILTICKYQAADDGRAALDRPAWLGRIDALAREGQRVLAFAVKPVGDRKTLAMEDMADGFTLLGIAGFIDPPRPEAITAVADCARAGIDAKMITGDHAITALAIARQLGLSAENGVLTGARLEAMDDTELQRQAQDVDVFARAAPEHKLSVGSQRS